MDIYRVRVMRSVSNDVGHEFEVPQKTIEVAAADEAAAIHEAFRLGGPAFDHAMQQPGNYLAVDRIGVKEPGSMAVVDG